MNFRFHGSPSEGWTVNTLNQPALGMGRGVMTAGQVTRDGALVSARVFARDDYTQCAVATGDFAPLASCPAGTDLVQTEEDSEESARAKMPLATRSSCAPGSYPRAEGEGGLVDACTPCRPGTHKAEANPIQK